ncbi:hypothetical protein RBB50_007595 [Rhinocladiella similis]
MFAIDQEMTDPLDEIVECWRFWTRDYWYAFTIDAHSTSSWREQNYILIHHLCAHYDRLSSYAWGPSQAWLVAWAISHADTPLQQWLSWSLHFLVPNEHDVTIQTFAEHLDLWADLFESRRVKYFREAVADDEPQFLYHQRAVGSPWIAHFLLSKPEYWQYTCEQWKKLCNQRLESTNAVNAPYLSAPSCVCTHPAPKYQAIGPEVLKDHLDSYEKESTASGALDYILSRYDKQKNNIHERQKNKIHEKPKNKVHKKPQNKIHEKQKNSIKQHGTQDFASPKTREHKRKAKKGKIISRVVKPAQFFEHVAKFKSGKNFPASKKKRSRPSGKV